MMRDYKLSETIADIAYYAGQKGYYSGDSMADMADFIWWAKEFEALHRFTDWEREDYMLAVELMRRKRSLMFVG